MSDEPSSPRVQDRRRFNADGTLRDPSKIIFKLADGAVVELSLGADITTVDLDAVLINEMKETFQTLNADNLSTYVNQITQKLLKKFAQANLNNIRFTLFAQASSDEENKIKVLAANSNKIKFAAEIVEPSIKPATKNRFPLIGWIKKLFKRSDGILINTPNTPTVPDKQLTTMEYWQACAKKRELMLYTVAENRYLKLEGIYRQYKLSIETWGMPIKRAIQEQSRYFRQGNSFQDESFKSIITIRFPTSLNLGLVIAPELEMMRSVPLRARGDIIVGDDHFDNIFEVRGYAQESVKKQLHPMVREKLLQLWNFYDKDDNFAVFDDQIIYKYIEFTKNPEQMMPLINAMTDVVNALFANRKQLFIKAVSKVERCEICHKHDQFDINRSYCKRCNHTSS